MRSFRFAGHHRSAAGWLEVCHAGSRELVVLQSALDPTDSTIGSHRPGIDGCSFLVDFVGTSRDTSGLTY